jgi:outer membrane lipoprotein-sorting protein
VSARSLALLGCLGLLVLAAAARSDEKTDAVFKKFQKTAAAAKTLQADLVITVDSGGQKQTIQGKMRLMKPKYGSVRILLPNGQPMQTIIADGKNVYTVFEAQKQYLKRAVGAKPGGEFAMAGFAASAFFDPKAITEDAETKYVGTEKIGDLSYEVVEFSPKGEQKFQMKAYFGPSGFMEGVDFKIKFGEQEMAQSHWLKNLKLNVPMKAQEFAYKPPKGYTVYQQPDYEKGLVAVGAPAPSFQLPQPGGGQLSLEDARKGKKAVLINFWFYN